ncbi:hypothetical protein CCHL11_08089 [Colletotrichum chlorophyti]|uniref:Ricin B lectin domain-containing protein n=1 Tax=Colletotrichum chlorophyti TaxID=708187 RepID=A0A1Q8RM84_9PEZI|nr:hypothetical protein CCHL11_08089 [Colletotrichum chlorophyti]
MIARLAPLLACAALFASASPVIQHRAVTELNEEATREAHQRDETATRAFANVQIKTADGRCLFVDKLSGDFRANLTPIQVAGCGAKDGQGWDVITAGKHNDQPNSALIVSTLTQACFNLDARRKEGNQILLFSCGGRAAGEGSVTNSQLFKFGGGAGPLAFQPENGEGKCLTVKGDVVDVAACNTDDKAQSFTFGGAAGGGAGAGAGASNGEPPASTTPAAVATGTAAADCEQEQTITMTVTSTVNPAPAASTAPPVGNGGKGNIPAANPTTPVPVSRAGGTLNPTAAAEANAFDDTATRAFTKVAIRAPNGQCLSVDPTAGDFRQNLIPVALVECNNTPNEQFDVVTKGRHNDGKDGAALIVSSLTNGCVSTDGRRADGDTVTVFSCGGRAAGEGGTNTGQLVKVQGKSFVWSPVNDKTTCVVPGSQGRLVTAACKGDNSEVYTILG